MALSARLRLNAAAVAADGAPAAAAAGRGGRGVRVMPEGAGRSRRADQQQPPQRPQVTIDHIAYTMKNWDKTRVKAILESWGLYPTEDQDSLSRSRPVRLRPADQRTWNVSV